MNKRNLWRYLMASLLMVCFAGCGNKPLEVKGSVTIKDQPVQRGSIRFESVDAGGSSLGGTIKDGQYSIVGKPSNTGGKKYVRITCIQNTGRKIPAGPPEPAGTMVDEIKTFSFGDTNELTCELQPGTVNEENFEL